MNDLDLLKSAEAFADVDPRSRMMLSHFDREIGEQVTPSLGDHRASVAEVVLDTHVPEEVRISFEVARNLYLYTYFVYRFGVVSNVQALQTLEYGLREKAKLEGVPHERRMLGALMRLSIDRGWLTDKAFEGIPGIRSPGRKSYSEILAKALPEMRNILAHGSFTLFEPYRALEQLRICAAILNFVFQLKDSRIAAQ